MNTIQCCTSRKGQVVISRGSQLFQQKTYLTSESNTTVNFCTPFKTSVNDMKYRERSNGTATHRDRAGSSRTWLHIDSVELESVIYRLVSYLASGAPVLYSVVLYGDIVHSVTYRQHINHCIVPSGFSVWINFQDLTVLGVKIFKATSI